MARRAVYPHVDEITDFPTSQSLRLLWERLFACQDSLETATATITAQATTISTLQSQITALQRDVGQALAPTQVIP